MCGATGWPGATLGNPNKETGSQKINTATPLILFGLLGPTCDQAPDAIQMKTRAGTGPSLSLAVAQRPGWDLGTPWEHLQGSSESESGFNETGTVTVAERMSLYGVKEVTIRLATPDFMDPSLRFPLNARLAPYSETNARNPPP